jgi:transposase
MEPILERCCGLDVHQATVTACLLIGAADTKPRKVIRTFSTHTHDLVALRDWLVSEGCTHVGMESTGIYWQPVYAILEGACELIVGNAQHIKHVPGRKTDVKDSEWLAELVRHGLMAKSFVPPKPFRELRELLRYRRKLIESRTTSRNRLLRLLETANVKLASIASNVFGVSGMHMLRALVRGGTSPQELAQLAKGALRKKTVALALALEGHVEDHHRFVLDLQLRQLDHLESLLAELDQRIEEKLQPVQPAHQRLMQIPGVDRIVAAVLLSELGTDMRVFKSAHHAAAWAGVCPGNNESAGHQREGRVRKGNLHLKTMLVQAAHAAVRHRPSYLHAKFLRLKTRRGPQRAAMAIAHKILIAAYHLLSTGQPYRDLGETYLDQLNKARLAKQLVRRLTRLGYDVQVNPSGA